MLNKSISGVIRHRPDNQEDDMNTEYWREMIEVRGGVIHDSIVEHYSVSFRNTFDIICASGPATGRADRNAIWRQMAKNGWLVQGRKDVLEGTDIPRAYRIEAFRKKR